MSAVSRKDDFALTEDGRPQQIAVFEKQSELPLNLTLAIDTSGSVQKDLTEEAAAARRFAHALVRPQDQMSVMQFATEVRALTPFTNKLSLIDRGLNQLRGGWATALYDAIDQGSELLGAKEGRKVLVVISDGDDTAKNTTYADALEQALRNEVMIYSLIDVPIEASAGRSTGGEHALITLAEQTGGKYFYVNEGGLDKAFAKGQRRPAHPIPARLLSTQSGAGPHLSPHSRHGSPRRVTGLYRPPQDRLLLRLKSRRHRTSLRKCGTLVGMTFLPSKAASVLCMFAVFLAGALPGFAKSNHGKIRVLIVDGFSNHDWQQTTQLLRGILDRAGEFKVDVSTVPQDPDSPEWAAWRPRFLQLRRRHPDVQ